MSIFLIKNNKAELLEPTAFKEGNMLEKDIQNIIKSNPKILGEELLIVGEELSPFENSKKRLDLLALDEFGKLVVIELKRDNDGFHMDLQAIRYASMVRLFSIDQIVEFYNNFHNCDNEQTEKVIDNFLGGDYAQKLDFDNVRIILVNQDFSKDITNTVLWLNEQGLDIKCIKINPYKLNDKSIWDVDVIIPVKEAQEYQLKLKEKKNSDQETRRQTKDKTKYSFNGKDDLGKGRLVLEVIKFYVNQNPNITLEQLQNIFHKDLRIGSLKIVNDINEIDDLKRYFTSENDLLILNDKEVAICNQWGIGNIKPFIEYAQNQLNYDIKVSV